MKTFNLKPLSNRTNTSLNRRTPKDMEWISSLQIPKGISNTKVASTVLMLISESLGVICQDDVNEEGLTDQQILCKDKEAGELFRITAGEENCRDVIQCTAAVCKHYKHHVHCTY